MPVTVELRGAGDRQLREIVREGFPQLVRELARHGRALPRHVAREFEAYLSCGDASLGFAWFCPSCGGRRMAEGAANLVDKVIPHVATRQWVLTVPWKRRWLLARRPDLADGVLRAALRAVERWYRGATGRRGGKSGSFTAIQRFGSAVNLNLHFHVVHVDGVFDRGADGALRFFQAAPTTEDVEGLVVEIALACERWLARQGFGGDVDDAEPEDDAQGVLQLASLSGAVALGERAGHKVRRVVMLGGKEFALGPRCASFEGYNVHANVALPAHDRKGLERLCRYVLRPPLAVDRIERRPDGRVRVGMKRVWSDGTGAIELSPLELAEKLAAIVPPARSNQVLYHGILAGNAAWRKEVIPKVASSTEAEREARASLRLVKRAGQGGGGSIPAAGAFCWAELLKRVFAVDGWACPSCGERMRLRAVVDGGGAPTRVLTGLLRARGPPETPPEGDDRGVHARA